MVKRANNEGTFTKLPSGHWRAQLSVDGRRIGKTFPTRAAAVEWVKATLNQVDHGLTFQASRITVQQFLVDWLELKRSRIAKNTYSQYSDAVRRFIVPQVGKLRLLDLTPARIQNLYSRLQSVTTARFIQITHVVLHGAMQHAMAIGLISRNPTDNLLVPEYEHRKITTWSESEVSRFLVSIRGERNEYLYHLALVTGLRRGELLGLQWSDLDWQTGVLHIQRQAVRLQGGVTELADTKTAAGVRSILLGAGMISKLQEQFRRVNIQRLAAGSRWHENDLIFPSTTGKIQYGDSLSGEFVRLSERAGVPRIRFHDLRHTSITLVLSRNAPTMLVSQRSGHSKPSITTDIYGHPMPETQLQEAIAAIMDEITTPVEVDL